MGSSLRRMPSWALMTMQRSGTRTSLPKEMPLKRTPGQAPHFEIKCDAPLWRQATVPVAAWALLLCSKQVCRVEYLQQLHLAWLQREMTPKTCLRWRWPGWQHP